MDFGSYELYDYVYAAEHIKDLKQEYEAERAIVLTEIYPTTSLETGRMIRQQVSTETAGIELASLSADYEAKINRCVQKAEKFNDAMNLLNDMELRAFNHHIHGIQSGLSYRDVIKYYATAKDKLCFHLEQEKIKQIESIEYERKQEIKNYIYEEASQ